MPLQVQVDLLADAWARHRKRELIEASLLDAAVVFAAIVGAGMLWFEQENATWGILGALRGVS